MSLYLRPAAISLVLIGIHFVSGGREVVRPLLASRELLSEVVHALAYSPGRRDGGPSPLAHTSGAPRSSNKVTAFVRAAFRDQTLRTQEASLPDNTHVVVIGGGYAGVLAANRLTKRDDVTVTLINPRAHFVERIRLHQLVGGSDDAVVDYRDVLAERVRLAVDTVTRINVSDRSVELDSGGTVGYDYLVYATGSGSASPVVPGATEFAHPIATLEAAERLRNVLDSAPAAAAVTVIGAGPTGIETAAELAELGRTVTLVCGGVLGPYLHSRGRRSVAKHLARLGVTVLDGQGSTVTAVTRDAVQLRDRRALASDVTI